MDTASEYKCEYNQEEEEEFLRSEFYQDFDMHGVYSTERSRSLRQTIRRRKNSIKPILHEEPNQNRSHVKEVVFCIRHHNKPEFYMVMNDSYTIEEIFTKIRTEVIEQAYTPTAHLLKQHSPHSSGLSGVSARSEYVTGSKNIQYDYSVNNIVLLDIFMYNSATNHIKSLPYDRSTTLRSFMSSNKDIFSSENTENIKTNFGLIYCLYYIDTNNDSENTIETPQKLTRTIDFIKRIFRRFVNLKS